MRARLETRSLVRNGFIARRDETIDHPNVFPSMANGGKGSGGRSKRRARKARGRHVRWRTDGKSGERRATRQLCTTAVGTFDVQGRGGKNCPALTCGGDGGCV